MDADVQEFGHLPEPSYTPASVQTMIDEQAQPGMERGDLAVLCIANAVTEEFAGSLVLFGVTAASVEVGFWLHPEYRGCGFATAALELAAQFASGSGLSTLTARTAIENVSSQRVLTAAGFTRVGTAMDSAPSGHQIRVHFYERFIGP